MTNAANLEPVVGDQTSLGGLGLTLRLRGKESLGAFSVVEYSMSVGGFAGPPHIHSREDEYSFVIAGRVAAMVGERTLTAGPGEFLVKHKGIPHTFWNDGDMPARILEVISPANFENYFFEVDALFTSGPPDMGKLCEVAAKYGLSFPGGPEYWAELSPIMMSDHPDHMEVVAIARRHRPDTIRL